MTQEGMMVAEYHVWFLALESFASWSSPKERQRPARFFRGWLSLHALVSMF